MRLICFNCGKHIGPEIDPSRVKVDHPTGITVECQDCEIEMTITPIPENELTEEDRKVIQSWQESEPEKASDSAEVKETAPGLDYDALAMIEDFLLGKTMVTEGEEINRERR